MGVVVCLDDRRAYWLSTVRGYAEVGVQEDTRPGYFLVRFLLVMRMGPLARDLAREHIRAFLERDGRQPVELWPDEADPDWGEDGYRVKCRLPARIRGHEGKFEIRLSDDAGTIWRTLRPLDALNHHVQLPDPVSIRSRPPRL